jgi:hypothetical protein
MLRIESAARRHAVAQLGHVDSFGISLEMHCYVNAEVCAQSRDLVDNLDYVMMLDVYVEQQQHSKVFG